MGNTYINDAKESAKILIKCYQDIEPQNVEWLWHGRIAIGKITMIAGDPGLGKSMVTASLAAHVTTGKPWPVDHAICPRGDVLIMSAEDDPADTIRPRLDAAGADVSRIHDLGMVQDWSKEGEPFMRSFSLTDDLKLLEDSLMAFPETKLVTIDPVSAFVGDTDSHKNADIRRVLAPLSDIASHHRVSIVIVTHLNKGTGNALQRATGSIAFVAAARAAFLITKDEEDPARRLMLPMKNNLGDDYSGFAYTIETTEKYIPFVCWENDPVTVSADDALKNVQEDHDATAEDEAMKWLLVELESGAVPSRDLIKKARGDGHSKRTLDRAKKKLGITSKRKDGHWCWIAATGTYSEDSNIATKEATNIAKACDHEVANLAESLINTEDMANIDSQDCQDCQAIETGLDGNEVDDLWPSDREAHAQDWRSRISRTDVTKSVTSDE
jgi:putative DNA primase/helicase